MNRLGRNANVSTKITEKIPTHKWHHHPATEPGGIRCAFPERLTDPFQSFMLAEEILLENAQCYGAKTQVVKGKKHVDWVSECEQP